MGSLLVMSKLPNFVFRKILNCTGCQIFILGYHLSITFSIILGATLSAILGATLSAILGATLGAILSAILGAILSAILGAIT